jgi:hypothetical protein
MPDCAGSAYDLYRTVKDNLAGFFRRILADVTDHLLVCLKFPCNIQKGGNLAGGELPDNANEFG